MSMSEQEKIDAITAGITKRMSDEGKLIEAGWISLRTTTLAEEISPDQLDLMRIIFFAGAQHLFGSIMMFLSDTGDEPTKEDEDRMEKIDRELNKFIEEF